MSMCDILPPSCIRIRRRVRRRRHIRRRIRLRRLSLHLSRSRSCSQKHSRSLNLSLYRIRSRSRIRNFRLLRRRPPLRCHRPPHILSRSRSRSPRPSHRRDHIYGAYYDAWTISVSIMLFAASPVTGIISIASNHTYGTGGAILLFS